MSTTQGVFSETNLLNIRVKAEMAMADKLIARQFTPQIDSVEALNRINTATIRQYIRTDKHVKVELEWINACQLAEAANVACETGGNEASTNTDVFEITRDRMVKFSIKENTFRTNDFDMDEVRAKEILMADKKLSEGLAQYFISVLNTNKGTNEINGGKGTVSGTDTYVIAANWDYTMYAYLIMVADYNRFSDPVIVSGKNLYEAFINSGFAAGNADGKAGAAAFSALPTYFDIKNLLAVNTTDVTTYMVETGSVAWASEQKYSTSVERKQNETRYSFPSQFIPGLWLNAQIVESCDNDYTKEDWKITAKYDIWAMPTDCTAANTGILTFICGTVPQG